MNVVTLQGRLARPAAERVLPSGDRLVNLEVTTDGPDGKAETVPVAWFSAPSSAADLDADQEVVVVGRVRRRFFRGEGGPQSRTEMLGKIVLQPPKVKKLHAALPAAAARIEDSGDPRRE